MINSAEKPLAHQNHQQVLKCPRCNSLNTKFCYYNNYSLSQPRHFCKACKRYWTSGGTLRNVPVGGSCRKNKRIKRPFTAVDDLPNPNLNLDHSTPLYGSLQPNPKYPRFNTRVSDVSRYDLVQPQMSSLGLGFSSSDNSQGDVLVPLVSNNPSVNISGGMITSTCNSDHTMPSLLASNLQQQATFLGFAPYANGGGSVVNEVQMGTSLNGQNDNDQRLKGLESCDPTSFLWTISGGDDGGEWHDPTSNISVPSLI